MQANQTNSTRPAPTPRQIRNSRWKLLAVLAVCASPLIFSYLTYYVIKPGGRTNYGELIDPRAHPIPVLASTSLDGKPTELTAYQGKWLLLKVGPSACPKTCMDQMFAIRQLRAMQGKEMERIERVWLITDRAPLETDGDARIRRHAHMLRADAAEAVTALAAGRCRHDGSLESTTCTWSIRSAT